MYSVGAGGDGFEVEFGQGLDNGMGALVRFFHVSSRKVRSPSGV